MTLKEFFSFKQNALFWGNLIAMVVVLALLVWGVLEGLDRYTRHGEAVEVPNVKGVEVEAATHTLQAGGLAVVISDSTYVKTMPAGCVLDCVPSAGQRVKRGRTIYLTINTLSVPLRAVPDVADNSSLRQAEASLLAGEFKLDSIERVSGELDWVYGVKYKGRLLRAGEKVPEGSILTLMVGCGGELPTDSDSVAVVHPVPSQEPASGDDNWF